MERPLRIGTRGSPLALVQARLVEAGLAAAWPRLAEPRRIEIVPIRTAGDRIQDRTLAEIGGKGLFTEEIEAGLLDGSLDLAVHSMKDMSTRLPEGLMLAAFLPREDPRDVLVAPAARRIADLPRGAVVGTAALRRKAQLLHLRPDLRVVPFRGNVGTRLRKLDEGEAQATFLALAGLNRLGRGDLGAPVPVEEMLPAVGQGAICIECRAGDAAVRALLERLDHARTAAAVRCEHALLAELDGSCRTPIAGHAEFLADGSLRLRARIVSPDGALLHETERVGPAGDGPAMGHDAGRDLKGRAGPGFFAA